MPRTDPPAAANAAGHVPIETGDQVERPASTQEPSITETVATALGGVVAGGAALWFLAPSCFSC